MDFVSNQETQIREMLDDLAINSIDDLLEAIPKAILLSKIKEDDGLSEMEGAQLIESLSAKNTFPSFKNYLGAGAYEHHVPAIVSTICSKSEFLTSYTPYQAEASQGMLQAIFEFQSAICALTGLDVANASLYDGASACAESVLMALRVAKPRNKILVAESLIPLYRKVVDQYLKHSDVQIETIPFQSDGTLNLEVFNQKVDSRTAAVLLSYPNFFGTIDPIQNSVKKAKEVGALIILSANPLVYGLYQSAAELGADIAVGDCQPFGIPLQFGGPYAGYIACTENLVRQLPGRIVGETVDLDGNPGYVLTLQAREQHIRREKATSNICTNQALVALGSLVAMLWYGKEGVRKLALTNFQRASYLKQNLERISGIRSFSTAPHFNEFVVEFSKPIEEVVAAFRKVYIEPGIELKRFYPKLKNHLLIAATETKSKEDLDHYIATAKAVCK